MFQLTGSGKVEEIPKCFTIVQPAIARTRARFPPDEACLVWNHKRHTHLKQFTPTQTHYKIKPTIGPENHAIEYKLRNANLCPNKLITKDKSEEYRRGYEGK